MFRDEILSVCCVFAETAFIAYDGTHKSYHSEFVPSSTKDLTRDKIIETRIEEYLQKIRFSHRYYSFFLKSFVTSFKKVFVHKDFYGNKIPNKIDVQIIS